MRKVQSCGVLVFRKEPQLSFLLLKHPHRYDLPKGHRQSGETEKGCAWRELLEETGLSPTDVKLDRDFRHEFTYFPVYKRLGGKRVEKTVIVFLGWLLGDKAVTTSEHAQHEWVRWSPPHSTGSETLDELLAAVETHFLFSGKEP
jgi:8-oxo-dGTP pyrophosphatase MutT (NUDIX family)